MRGGVQPLKTADRDGREWNKRLQMQNGGGRIECKGILEEKKTSNTRRHKLITTERKPATGRFEVGSGFCRAPVSPVIPTVSQQPVFSLYWPGNVCRGGAEMFGKGREIRVRWDEDFQQRQNQVLRTCGRKSWRGGLRAASRTTFTVQCVPLTGSNVLMFPV